ncbi:MAG: hypothetical protein K1060chlam5_00248, partial [Candidatus Anoxychlamydiales bacterium]|nr:hypothetical protein [Candidatus Anoxychlamydiales bacterium]
IQKVLQMGIENKGCTLGNSKSNFSSIFEDKGKNQNFLYAHGKVNKKCKFCENNIIKIKLFQRGTYICKKCQKI